MNKILRKLFFEKVINNEEGSMLIMSLLIATVFVTFGAAYLGLVAVEASNTERTHRSNLAMHIAESGTEEAIWEIKYNNSNFLVGDGWTDVSTETVDTSDTIYRKTVSSFLTSTAENLGSYTVMVTDPDGNETDPEPDLPPIIKTTGNAIYQGSIASESRTIEVTLAYPATYEYAAFADSNIDMNSNACTDSYDSSAGPYDGPYGPNPPDAPHNNYSTEGDIGTNSTDAESIDMLSNAAVHGDAEVGVGGDPNTVIDFNEEIDKIDGTETPLISAVTIPSVSSPTGLTNNGDLSLTGTNTHTIGGSGQYGNITLDGDSVLTITGNTTVYLTNTFHVDSNAQLVIANGAKVKFYVDGAITFDSTSEVNNISKDPNKLAFFGTDSMVDDGGIGNEKIHFNSNAIIHATIQAKNATVRLDSDTEVFGAVLANNVRMDSNACIHYDTSLSGGSSGSNATVALWQEK